MTTDKPALPPSSYLIIGPGASGVSTALDVFGDFGFLTAGQVEPSRFAQLFDTLSAHHANVAYSLAIRPEDIAALPELGHTLADLKARHPEFKILGLDAPEPVLIQRYLDSGKPHGFEASAGGLQQAATAEKGHYATLRALRDYSIDTSTTTPGELRNKIAKILGLDARNQEMTVYITSFGFKYGIPQDAELMFDMRFITNPFYVDDLRPLTGLDKPVQDYIFAQPHARTFLAQWTELIGMMLPRYQAEGKTRISIAVGCTGGKHRSVCMAEELSGFIRGKYSSYNVIVTHRENARWEQGKDFTRVAVGDAP